MKFDCIMIFQCGSGKKFCEINSVKYAHSDPKAQKQFERKLHNLPNRKAVRDRKSKDRFSNIEICIFFQTDVEKNIFFDI